MFIWNVQFRYRQPFSLFGMTHWSIYITQLFRAIFCLEVLNVILLSLQPAPPREAHFVSTKKNAPQLLEPIPYEFMA